MASDRALWAKHLADRVDGAGAPAIAGRGGARASRPRSKVSPQMPPDTAPDKQVFEIRVQPAPRQSRSDAWKKRPSVMQYRAFCDHIRLLAKGIPHRFLAIVDLPMPASWSETRKRAMDGMPHQVKPDFDNLSKAIVDAICPRADAHIYDGRVIKRYARSPRLVIQRIHDNAHQAD